VVLWENGATRLAHRWSTDDSGLTTKSNTCRQCQMKTALRSLAAEPAECANYFRLGSIRASPICQSVKLNIEQTGDRDAQSRGREAMSTSTQRRSNLDPLYRRSVVLWMSLSGTFCKPPLLPLFWRKVGSREFHIQTGEW